MDPETETTDWFCSSYEKESFMHQITEVKIHSTSILLISSFPHYFAIQSRPNQFGTLPAGTIKIKISNTLCTYLAVLELCTCRVAP